MTRLDREAKLGRAFSMVELLRFSKVSIEPDIKVAAVMATSRNLSSALTSSIKLRAEKILPNPLMGSTFSIFGTNYLILFF